MAKTNQEEQRKAPILRFKGFTDDWEQVELKNIFKKLNERNEKLYFDDSKTISISKMKYNPVGNGAKKLNQYKVLRIGDVAFEGHTNKQFKFGRFVLNDLGDGIISPRFAAIRPVNKIDILFWKYYIHSEKVMHNILVYSTKCGTMMNELVYFDFFKQNILVPNNHEQNKIGIILKYVSKLLALYERKIKLLSQIKKYFLDNLFAENKYPNLRFKGFTNAWEHRKIKDYAEYRRGSFPQPYRKKEWYDGKESMPFVQVVDVKDNFHLVDNTKQRISKIAQSKSVFVSSGKVLVTVQGSIGRVAITQYPSYIDRTLIVFEHFNILTDKYFWAYIIKRKFEIEKQKAPGGTIKTITKKALSNFEIIFPKYPEQKTIGSFFSKFDNIISLYEDKLKKIKQIKKELLDTMFI